MGFLRPALRDQVPQRRGPRRRQRQPPACRHVQRVGLDLPLRTVGCDQRQRGLLAENLKDDDAQRENVYLKRGVKALYS